MRRGGAARSPSAPRRARRRRGAASSSRARPSGTCARRRRAARARAGPRAAPRRSRPAPGSRARRRRPSARSPAPRRRAPAARPARASASVSSHSIRARRRGSRLTASLRLEEVRGEHPRRPRRGSRARPAARGASSGASSRRRAAAAREAAPRVHRPRAISTIARAGSESGSRQDERLARVGRTRAARASSGTEPSSGTPSCVGEPLAAAGAEHLRGHVLDHAEQRACRSSAPSRRARRRPPARAAAASSRSPPRRAAAAGRARSRRRRCRRHVDERARRARPSARPARNCSSARCSIGPRHISGALSSRKKPIDISFRSCATGGMIILSTTHRLLVDAEHVRDRVAVDVGVEDADVVAELRERRGEVDGQRRLADAALAATRPRARASTRSSWIALLRGSTPPRSFVVSAARSSGVITSNSSRDRRRRPRPRRPLARPGPGSVARAGSRRP